MNDITEKQLPFLHVPAEYRINPVFSADEKYFFTIYDQDCIHITDLNTGQKVKKISFYKEIIGMLVSNDGNYLCVSTTYPVKIHLLDISDLPSKLNPNEFRYID